MEKLRPEVSPGHSASESGPGTRMQSSELTLRALPPRAPHLAFFFSCLHSDLLGSRKLLWTALLAAEGPTDRLPPGLGPGPSAGPRVWCRLGLSGPYLHHFSVSSWAGLRQTLRSLLPLVFVFGLGSRQERAMGVKVACACPAKSAAPLGQGVGQERGCCHLTPSLCAWSVPW